MWNAITHIYIWVSVWIWITAWSCVCMRLCYCVHPTHKVLVSMSLNKCSYSYHTNFEFNETIVDHIQFHNILCLHGNTHISYTCRNRHRHIHIFGYLLILFIHAHILMDTAIDKVFAGCTRPILQHTFFQYFQNIFIRLLVLLSYFSLLRHSFTPNNNIIRLNAQEIHEKQIPKYDYKRTRENKRSNKYPEILF